MKLREWSKLGLLTSILLLFLGIGALLRRSTSTLIYTRQCDCSTAPPSSSQYLQTPEERGGIPPPFVHPQPRTSHATGPRYLSFQPPGNGWNNQRIALENALVLAKLLNRTLVVHPLAPHELGARLKVGQRPGYLAYNMLNATDLLPPAYFLDLRLMSQLLPVIAVNTSHPQFLHEYSRLRWKKVCHSTGFGYWVDQPPALAEEVELLSMQKFTPIKIWQGKCPEEQERAKRDPSPLVKYVSDLERETAEMLYFEQGTLFGIHIRFTTKERALEAQQWVLDHVQYGPPVWKRVEQIVEKLGTFNAIQVRRRDHMDKRLGVAYWLDRMIAMNFSTDIPVYIATDHYDINWFSPFQEQGFKLFTATNFSKILNFYFLPKTVRDDYLGIHEQCICERAQQFIPSPASTFAAFILRRRGEVRWRDELIQDTLHTYWIGHQAKAANLNYKTMH